MVECYDNYVRFLLLLFSGDAGVGGNNGSGMDEENEDTPVYQSSMKGGGSGGASSNPMESASLSEYAKFTLKTICSQEWVREIFLKDPEKLWTPEVLLDEVLTCKQVNKVRIQDHCSCQTPWNQLASANTQSLR